MMSITKSATIAAFEMKTSLVRVAMVEKKAACINLPAKREKDDSLLPLAGGARLAILSIILTDRGRHPDVCM